jgi:hypothetical protein
MPAGGVDPVAADFAAVGMTGRIHVREVDEGGAEFGLGAASVTAEKSAPCVERFGRLSTER